MVVNSRLSMTYSGVNLQHSGLCMADHILSNSRQLVVKGDANYRRLLGDC